METSNTGTGRPNWARRTLIGAAALLGVSAVGIAGALSQGMGGPMGGFGGPLRVGERGIERALEDVKATPDQEQKIWAIVDRTHSELRPLMQGFRGTREEMASLLTGATVDPAAVEKLRAARIADVDQASKTMTAALVEAAQVLTPQQRAKLAADMKDGGMGGGGRW